MTAHRDPKESLRVELSPDNVSLSLRIALALSLRPSPLSYPWPVLCYRSDVRLIRPHWVICVNKNVELQSAEFEELDIKT